jgi:hypothetical protein
VRAFTAGELGRMEDTQEGAMQDTCRRMVFVEDIADAYGMPATEWVEDVALECGFDAMAKPEAMEGTEVVMADAVMRLPMGTELDHRDRLKVTHRFGVMVEEPETFEVIGEAERGPSGLVLKLRLVTDGSG